MDLEAQKRAPIYEALERFRKNRGKMCWIRCKLHETFG